MASKKKHVKEQLDAEANSAFLSHFAEEGVASAPDSNPSHSTSSTASLADDTSMLKSDPVSWRVHFEKGSKIQYSGYPQPSFFCDSEAMPTHLGSLAINGDRPKDPASVVAGPKPNAFAAGSAASQKLEGLNSIKSDAYKNHVSRLPLDSRSRPSGASSNFSKSTNKSQPPNPLNKFGSAHQSAGYPLRKFSSLSNQVQGQTPDKSPLSHRSSSLTWDGNDKFQFSGDGDFRHLKEPNRGPRALRDITAVSSSFEKDQLEMVKRDHYNRKNFQTVYENAKFFVIKSYSEDDVHKSIKYNVWSSTPNGNKKLDAAFHEAETISNGSGSACPLFLFFSVNGSGQFLGVAEMVGKVDYKKDMDFWQEAKWNGFFPVKWYIIKDIPNSNLRHIILENNDNRPVTHTRDTHEIEFKQGSQMLAIFKGYRARTSILDDFSYYEKREKTIHERSNDAVSSQIDTCWPKFPEKTIHEKRSSLAASAQIDTYRNKFLEKTIHEKSSLAASSQLDTSITKFRHQQQHSGAGSRRVERASMWTNGSFQPKTSPTTLTKSLPLSSHLPRPSSEKNFTRH